MADWRPGRPLRLETERFVLRSMVPSDISATYVSWWNDPEIQASFGLSARAWDIPRALRHLQQFDNRRLFHLGIFPKPEDRSVGFITIRPKDAGCPRTRIVVGDKNWWGKGLPLEARARVFDFLFDDFGATKICGEVDARNFPSIFNYKAQGFVCEGVLRQQTPWPDGTRHDLILFGLLKNEWRARRKNEQRAAV